jgi:hypothetical protein
MLESFNPPLSIEAHNKLAQLQEFVHDVSLIENTNDAWVFKLGTGLSDQTK